MSDEFANSGNEYENKSDSEFGLPEVTLEPIHRGSEGNTAYTASNRYSEPERSSSNTGMIIGIIFAVLLLLAAGLYFFKDSLFGGDEGQLTEETFQNDDNNTFDDYNSTDSLDAITEPVTPIEEEETEVEPEPVTPTRGSLDVVSNRTGRTYVIIGSFVDEDLARDHAAILARQGINTSLLMPTQQVKFYRLAVADFGSISEAASELENKRQEFNKSDLWIIKN